MVTFYFSADTWNEVVKFLYENLDLPLITPKMGEAYEVGAKFKQDFWWKEE